MSLDSSHSKGHRGRLRERFAKNGLAGFADYEVVNIYAIKNPAGKVDDFTLIADGETLRMSKPREK